MSDEHDLTHVEVDDSFGRRLVPACICGWWSPDGSHRRFERHIRKATNDESMVWLWESNG